MSFSNDEISNNMNQNQNNSSTITDELILQTANMLRNGLGIQQIQANFDKGQGCSRLETVGRRPSQRHMEDKGHIHCTHYGRKKHTKETCFKIVGYPEWWKDSKPKNRKAATATVTHGGGKREEVYTEAPLGFSKDFQRNEVCKLKKTFYGLKQSPHA